MFNKEQFDWVEFYEEFAQKLLNYKNNRTELVNIVENVYKDTGIGIPKLDNQKLVDIDPFTVFGLFNKGITKENRIKIISSFANKLKIQAKIPTSFDSIPVLNNLSAVYFSFTNRDEYIEVLWKLFESALKYSNNQSKENRDKLSHYFDLVINKKYNANSKITMGLYWIAPNTFLNLDSRNEWYIYKSGKMPQSLINTLPKVEPKISSKTYFTIVDKIQEYLNSGKCELKNFNELSFEAWRYSEEDNKREKLKKENNIINNLDDLLIKFGDYCKTTTPHSSGKANSYKNAIKHLFNCFSVDFLNEEILQELNEVVKNIKNPQSNDYRKIKEYLTSVNAISYLEKDFITPAYPLFISFLNEYEIEKQEQIEKENNNTLEDENGVHYWIYSPGHNACKWKDFYDKGIMGIGWEEIGDLSQYSSREEIRQTLKEKNNSDSNYKNTSLCLWQFVHSMKPGDVIFAKKGSQQVIGKGIVQSDYYYDETPSDDYKNFRKVKWVENGNWNHPGQSSLKTLTDITQYTNYVKTLLDLVKTEEIEEDEKEQKYSTYTKDDFLNDVYMNNVDYYNDLVRILESEKNIILQGAPGVGKTYMAKRLAYSIIGEKNIDRVNIVQFHQSYSYEDFVMGFRPNSDGLFKLTNGVFYDFCKKAEIDEDNKYFFIIDEINRGNLSKIFGELFMLIEEDKRKNTSVQLVYSNEKFSVPENVYIIGMMNTADRSLAMLDYALRRRFAFFNIEPCFDSEGFNEYKNSIENTNFNNLINCVKKLNKAIEEDESLGLGFCIGHSYFCKLNKNVSDRQLRDIVEFKLIPLIREYWFDEQSKVNEWIFNLRSSIK